MKKSLLSSYIIIIYLSFQLVSSKQWRPDTYCISKVSVVIFKHLESQSFKMFSTISFFLSSERLFGKAWREEFVVLYEDSSLIWFRDRDRNEPEGGILLKDAPEMLAAGQVNAFAWFSSFYWELGEKKLV